MELHTKLVCAVTVLVVSSTCRAEQWFSVERPGARAHTLVEVDLDSIGTHGGGGPGVIRVSYDALQSHPSGFSYRSFVGNAQFECRRRSFALTRAVYYSLPGGRGEPLGTDIASRDSAITPALTNSIPAAAVHALLKATCARAQPT